MRRSVAPWAGAARARRLLTTLGAALALAGLASAHAAPRSAQKAPAHSTHHATHYTAADFDRVEKIDAHLHLHNPAPDFAQAARRLRMKLLTINVDYPDFPPIAAQQQVAESLQQAVPGQVAWAATFPVDRSAEAGWAAETTARIDAARARGAAGIKIWKNVGMELRDARGQLVMVDDPRFTPVFEHLSAKQIPLLGHQGEPHNCWLPLDRMTVNNDREYFKAHPQYHMALHPEMPSYETQMAVRDTMLARHPQLRFVGMHLASLEWSVDALAAFLRRNPKAYVDVAARIGQLQHQSQRHRAKVQRFFITHQDRLIYGSDLSQGGPSPSAAALAAPPPASGAAPDAMPTPAEQAEAARAFAAEAEGVWRKQWAYFATGAVQRFDEVDGPVRGLRLPRRVVDKLYRVNAERAFDNPWRVSAR